MPDVLSSLSAETNRNCEQIENDENCISKEDCYWAKVSQTNSKCYSITDPNIESIIEKDIYFTAPIPINKSQYEVLNLIKADKENFIRLAQQNHSFKDLLANNDFKDLLVRISSDEESFNSVVEYFKNRLSQERLKNKIPSFLRKKLEQFKNELRDSISGSVISLIPPPSTPPQAGFAPGRIPGFIDKGGTGTIVYEPDLTSPQAENSGPTGEYSLPNKQSPPLPPRKQPFNIEEEMRKSELTEQQFPGFWGLGEALN